eukprot:gene42015-52080_t
MRNNPNQQTNPLFHNKVDNRYDTHGSAQLLPCDHIKMLPENKHFKYRLLAGMINASQSVPNIINERRERSDFSSCYFPTKRNTELQRLFSIYSGEEEVIVRAVSYGNVNTYNLPWLGVGTGIVDSDLFAFAPRDSPLISIGETILQEV